MPLNELGDFLAGAFGPVAFLWLVIGYFQQQKELRLNTEALTLQHEELKKSVEQQQKMAFEASKQSESSLELLELQKDQVRREAEPHVILSRPEVSGPNSSNQGEQLVFRAEITLERSDIFNISFQAQKDEEDDQPTKVSLESTALQNGSKLRVQWNRTHTAAAMSHCIHLTYRDGRNREFTKRFRIRNQHAKLSDFTLLEHRSEELGDHGPVST